MSAAASHRQGGSIAPPKQLTAALTQAALTCIRLSRPACHAPCNSNSSPAARRQHGSTAQQQPPISNAAPSPRFGNEQQPLPNPNTAAPTPNSSPNTACHATAAQAPPRDGSTAAPTQPQHSSSNTEPQQRHSTAEALTCIRLPRPACHASCNSNASPPRDGSTAAQQSSSLPSATQLRRPASATNSSPNPSPNTAAPTPNSSPTTACSSPNTACHATAAQAPPRDGSTAAQHGSNVSHQQRSSFAPLRQRAAAPNTAAPTHSSNSLVQLPISNAALLPRGLPKSTPLAPTVILVAEE
jgi:hypothetical protein